MCKWYCTSNGPSTSLECLHCHSHYCAACLHGEGGVMESLIKCASCGKKPRVQPADRRSTWKGETQNGSEAAGKAYTPSSALKRASAGAAPANKSSIFDKLTNPALYTGTHVHRFDANGKGVGLGGRDSAAKGIGHNPAPQVITGSDLDLSSVVRTTDTKIASPTFKPQSPATRGTNKVSSAKGTGKSSIFDKLTDTSLYTGSHKNRFDANGVGRGMQGRDGASGIEYDSKRVTNLSQITRPNIR